MLIATSKNLWIAALASSLLASCASTGQSTGTRAPLDATLTAPCPPLDPLADGQAATVFRWALAAVDAYRDCADAKARLVEAVR